MTIAKPKSEVSDLLEKGQIVWASHRVGQVNHFALFCGVNGKFQDKATENNIK